MDTIQSELQQSRAFQILEKAFCDSPGMNWMLRDGNSASGKRRIIELMFYEALAKKGAYITSDENGVVLFFQVQNKKLVPRNILRTMYILNFVTGFRNGIRAIRYQRMVAKVRPKNGWLGLLVATDQSANGNAAAFEIKQEMFRIADESNECIYLETTVPRVRVLYKAAGYIEYAQKKHPYTNLMIWFFRRDPFTYSRNK